METLHRHTITYQTLKSYLITKYYTKRPNAVRSYIHGIVLTFDPPLSKKNIVFAKKRGSATWFLAISPLMPPIHSHACSLYINKKYRIFNNYIIGRGGQT